ncbi:MAG: dipeptidyl-peptidase 7 [Hirschia sp.]|nr:dipeptidyl-peptidase 7 [Hirschia sp.]MBF18477.1 dipeptidyl-peptidase 7 [Hirschia sp.]
MTGKRAAAIGPQEKVGMDPALISSEGMWRPDQLPGLAPELKALGLELPPKDLADLTRHPMNAVISLGNCTASFVSPQGLVVTNHHCAYGSIQYNSTEDNNLLADGFLAETMDAELPAAPGSRIYVTTAIDDVTDRVMADVTEDMTGRERYQAIDDAEKAIVAECEETAGYRCVVSAFHGGLDYRLTRRMEIKDVRLVYAPSDKIGKFGGDIDNWMWPRHTGDFSFYRAYVGPDGAPAEFAEENVPFIPPSFLSLYSQDLEDGDFVMAAGYPGRTSRYKRLSEVDATFNWSYPTRKTLYEEWVETIETTAPEGSDARIKYASLIASINNATKNYGGQMEGAERVGLVMRRKGREDALNSWIAADPEREARYAGAVAELDALVEESNLTNERDLYYGLVTRAAPLRAAKTLLRLAHEKQKPDAERESGYQERDLAFVRQGLEAMDRRYDKKVDQAVMMKFIKDYLQLPEDKRVPAFDAALDLEPGMADVTLERKLTRLFDETKLQDNTLRINLMDADLEMLENSADPMMKLAVALYDADMAMEEADKEIDGRFAALEPQYMEAIIAWQEDQGKMVYPDANSTLRVTFGTVKGDVSPKDGLEYTPFTTLEGISEKYTAEDPFDSPSKQMELIDAQDYGRYELDSLGSVPVNFLSTLDVTGGNSGSPTLNAKGELVGLLFDGTYESINSDWDFDTKTTRSIHVDARYMLWIMEKVDGATNLLVEMGVAEPAME